MDRRSALVVDLGVKDQPNLSFFAASRAWRSLRKRWRRQDECSLQSDSSLSRHCLVCLNWVMHRRLFCRSQHQLVSYNNEFTVNGAEGLIGNSGRNTADACDTNQGK